jgi:hypothetical protein
LSLSAISGAWSPHPKIPFLATRLSPAEGQTTHRGRGVELLGDRDEGDVMGIEQFDQFCKVSQRSGEAIDLIDHDDVDLVGSDIVQKLLQVRTIR